MRAYNRCGDYSYGVYIYAFPVQQSVAALVPGITPAAMFALAFPVTLALAVASWHLIEQRALGFKTKLVTGTRQLLGAQAAA